MLLSNHYLQSAPKEKISVHFKMCVKYKTVFYHLWPLESFSERKKHWNLTLQSTLYHLVKKKSENPTKIGGILKISTKPEVVKKIQGPCAPRGEIPEQMPFKFFKYLF